MKRGTMFSSSSVTSTMRRMVAVMSGSPFEVEGGDPRRAAALYLFIVAVAQLGDLGVGHVSRLGERQQIIRVVAVRGLPVPFAIAVAALEGNVVEGALFRLVFPDA